MLKLNIHVICLLLALAIVSHLCEAQVIRKPVYRKSKIQLGIVPGLGTNGIHSGEYINRLSINLFSGYSAGNQGMEISGLSNFSVSDITGLQFGGLANIVGGNIYVGLSTQERIKRRQFGVNANLTGVQLSGFLNYITGDAEGGQIGSINIIEKSLVGFQLAALSNIVNKYTLGFQVAGLTNASYQSIDGFQISTLYNYTRGELFGLQLGAFNQAGNIEGLNSIPSYKITGYQIGLFNTARKMNGYQVGLINYGSNVEGTQIGVINFSKTNKGYPFGLLNINSTGGHARLYFSEIFVTNLEISTGSENVQNFLTLHYNYGTFFNQGKLTWGFGYGIGKVVYNKAKNRFFNYDIHFSQLNPTNEIQRRLSLLTRLRATYGFKFPPSARLISYLFGGITFNSFFTDYDLAIAPGPVRIMHNQYDKYNLEMWPGLVLGIHLH